MQLRYLTLRDENGVWHGPFLQYNEDNEVNPYEISQDDGWEEVPDVEGYMRDRDGSK